MTFTDLFRQDILDISRETTLYEWTAQSVMKPLVIDRAKGIYFWDVDGKRYMDFNSQLMCVNIGHGDERVINAVKAQMDQVTYVAPTVATTAVRAELGRLLQEITPGNLTKAFFTNGGAEANENAIKIARWVTGRHKIIARYRSYHGATGGAITLTGDPRRWHAEPGLPGVVRMFDPYTYRCPAGHPDPCPVCTGAPHLEEILQYEGPQTVAAVIMETIVGTNGIIVPPDGYLQSIREVCDRHGILLISDEVMAGFGRTGRWFALDAHDVVPDLITFAKGVNSGYVPVGGVVIGEEVAASFDERVFPGGLTYSGHPLAAASIVAALDAMAEEGIVDHARRIGTDVLGPGLAALAERHRVVGE